MKSKLKICSSCSRERKIWKSEGKLKYCQRCWFGTKPKLAKPAKVKKQKKIAFASPKRALQNKEYSEQRKVFLEDHPFCEAKIEGIGCLGASSQVHHRLGRLGDLLLDQKYWLAVDSVCHEWIEKFPAKSKELGFSLKRNTK